MIVQRLRCLPWQILLCVAASAYATEPEKTPRLFSGDNNHTESVVPKNDSPQSIGQNFPPSRPNIILIMADDFGYENITVNGGESYITPSIDSLAADGMRFTNAFAQPFCTPSRVKLMSGRYNIRNYREFGKLDRGEFTFGNLLQSAGYATAVVGKWQLGTEVDAAVHFGFEQSLLWQHTTDGRLREGPGLKVDSRYPNPELQLNGKLVRYKRGEYGPRVCLDFILEFIDKHRDEPFFVYYPMILTHSPMDPTPDSPLWQSDRAGSKTLLGDLGDHQENFAAMVEYADKLVGMINAKLEYLGIRENTLLIFTGDNGNDSAVVSSWNGISVQGGKRQLDDSGTRVPLMASWPGVIPAGEISGDLVDFADFLPTFAEITRTEVPEGVSVDGVSFLPSLLGQPRENKDQVYVWSPGKGTMVRDDKFRLVLDHRSGDYSFYDDTLLYRPVRLDIENLDAEARASIEKLRIHMEKVDASSSILPTSFLRQWWSIRIYLAETYEELVKMVKRRLP